MKEVESRKTPLQVNMDNLGKQLSFLSFGIIAVIVLIGFIQKRNYLEMFQIGGLLKLLIKSYLFFFSIFYSKLSGSSNSRRVTYCSDSYVGIRSFKNGR